MKYDAANDIASPEGTTFIQYVGDNTDHDLATIDGKNTHHGLGSISIANGNFSNENYMRCTLPRDKKQKWSSIITNKGIPIKNYFHGDTSALKKIKFKSLTKLNQIQEPRLVKLLWNISYLYRSDTPSWAGYMSTVATAPALSKSVVTMLPIINLHATDMTALYSLLSFVCDQSKEMKIKCPPVITFDQPLYVKSYEIALSMNMNIVLRLGGFHQLMSFLGSIGNMMEGSGLRNALENIYAPISVNHMMTGKAYARAIRGHFLTSSALLSILLEEFWDSLSKDDQDMIQSFSESENPAINQEDQLAKNLVCWFKEKETELSKASRTSKLWFNYIRYINIVQDFITAERTNDWHLHIASSKKMLNLFAATGHNSYAKSCRLYLQSMEMLEQEHPIVYEQFLLGNHCVRRSERNWTGIWTDLSIEQILMKSLKGRGGVIGRGITENVLRVWTKTMHRCAEVTKVIDNLCFPIEKNAKHKELSTGRIKRDNEDFNKIREWFKTQNPFTCGEKLISIGTGNF